MSAVELGILFPFYGASPVNFISFFSIPLFIYLRFLNIFIVTKPKPTEGLFGGDHFQIKTTTMSQT